MVSVRREVQLSLFPDDSGFAPPRPDPLEVELLGDLHFCRYCPGGGEWWPADGEFFPINKHAGECGDKCRACLDEDRRANGDKPCIVDGCNEPRATWRVSRCIKHLNEQIEARKKARVGE